MKRGLMGDGVRREIREKENEEERDRNTKGRRGRGKKIKGKKEVEELEQNWEERRKEKGEVEGTDEDMTPSGRRSQHLHAPTITPKSSR